MGIAKKREILAADLDWTTFLDVQKTSSVRFNVAVTQAVSEGPQYEARLAKESILYSYETSHSESWISI